MVIAYIVLQLIIVTLNQALFAFARTPKAIATWGVSVAIHAALTVYGPKWLAVTILVYSAVVLAALTALAVGLRSRRGGGAV